MQDIPKDLIVEAQRGSIDAFEHIYNITSGFVYNLAYRVSNNKHDAEEITQDAFMKIHKKLKYFEFRASFKTWIYRIAVNTAINFIKSRSRKKHGTMEYDDMIGNSQTINELRAAQDKEDNEARVKSALSMLNPDQRSCVILRSIEGLSYEEIAETLRVNINTVRTRLKRAREKLMGHFHGKEVIRDAV